MSGARDQIMGQVRRALGRAEGTDDARARDAVDARLKEPPRGLIPARVRGREAEELGRLFMEKALAANCTCATVDSLEAVPDAIAEYLASENLPATVRTGDHPDLAAIPFDRRPVLTVSRGPSDGGDAVSLSTAFVGAAETGTLALVSGPGTPTTLNFLPETEIVLLRRSRIVGPYEDIWTHLRARNAEAGSMPRAVNLITGPSRTGDIEQKIELGAHGPLRLHILILDDL
ncbi:lactate utilization protein [Marivibrio halodurans]|uniref:Lactate utilization protein n=1 Tax=Marivibrio halodurans TaxID=2039722 RepID=A0A8J7S7C7_9PROT|nr:lactate utilization protein [Marivibrio halodurans]MBP5858174.1 lactate utilization protein [Marivibrio halodurans]